MDNDNQYKAYRDALDSTLPPAIPYLSVILFQLSSLYQFIHSFSHDDRGIFLTDLTFAEEANPEIIQNLINFRRSRIVFSIISRIQFFQQKSYRLCHVHQIQTFLRELTPRMGEKDLFKRSGMIEARGVERSALD